MKIHVVCPGRGDDFKFLEQDHGSVLWADPMGYAQLVCTKQLPGTWYLIPGTDKWRKFSTIRVKWYPYKHTQKHPQ